MTFRVAADVPDFTVRPARADDRDAVVAFCRQTWDFGDYIDQVWDRWLADPETLLLVIADGDDRPVGLGQVRIVSPGDAWLEGLRVDPAVRRQGLARLIAEAVVRLARERGVHEVRFATLATNEPMHHLAPQLGFRRVGVFTFWQADPLADGDDAAWVPAGDDPAGIAAFLAQRATVAAIGGLISAGWSYAAATAEVLARWIGQHPEALRRWPAAGAPLAYAWVEPDEEGEPLSVSWLATDGQHLSGAARALRGLAGAGGWPAVHLRLPEAESFAEAAAAAGFTRIPEPGFWIYSCDVM